MENAIWRRNPDGAASLGGDHLPDGHVICLTLALSHGLSCKAPIHVNMRKQTRHGWTLNK